MALVGLVGWRGMVGSVLMDRMQAEADFDLIEPLFFSTSNAGGAAPRLAKNETRLHDARRQGELSHEQIAEIWMGVQTESLGPAFDFTPDYGCYWAYIPHFIHTPFYVYAYAFGDCLVNALYGVFREGGIPGFEQKYLDMLRAGGTKRHKELLAPFGLDASDPAFWKRGLDVIAGFIDELEELPAPAHG